MKIWQKPELFILEVKSTEADCTPSPGATEKLTLGLDGESETSNCFLS